MALKDTFKSIFNYFEVDDAHELEDQREDLQREEAEPRMRVAPQVVATAPATEVERQPEMRRATSRSQQVPAERTPVQRLNDRQNELLTSQSGSDKKTIIDIKFPKRYEDAPEIVNLLLGNASVLIDFQYMSETQARRCLDYLDGARSVLAGSMKKVSNTMWLLTPVNVTVHIEELRSSKSSVEVDEQYNFDVRR